MSLTVTAVTAGHAHQALADAVGRAKRGAALRPVTVIAPTNAAGVTARRQLGRLGGVAAVDMLTLPRFAERLAAPGLRAAGKLPVSSAVVDLAIRRVLASRSTAFDDVRDHTSTIVALRDVYRELRLAGPAAIDRLSRGSRRGREVARVVRLVAERLAGDWYDEGELLSKAAAIVAAGGLPAALERVVVFLPQRLGALEIELVKALAVAGEVTVLLGVTGEREADRDLEALGQALGVTTLPPRTAAARATVELVSVTDADEEARHAVRAVVDAARGGTPLGRIAVLWPSERPYARLVEHHLDVAGIAWNGRPGTKTGERLVPRFLLDLLDVDRRGLRRRDLFDLLADVPVGDGQRPVPVTAWERVSRDAGVVRDEHWNQRLRAYATRQRTRAREGRTDDEQGADADAASLAAAQHAEQLAEFVATLRAELGPPSARRTWADWVEWSLAQIEARIGPSRLQLLGEAEQLAWEHTSRVLDRLRHLDSISGPATRGEFRAVFAAEFDAAPGRLGRIGAGVTIGSLPGAVGLAADFVIVLGAADGLMPPAPSVDPLLSDDDRGEAGLSTSRTVADRTRRQLLGVLDSASRVVIVTPRGDLRTTTSRQPSRWLNGIGAERSTILASHAAALLRTPFPAHSAEHRLRRRAALALATGPRQLAASAAADDDPVLARALALRAARRSDTVTVYDGDLTAVGVPALSRPVSPTQLQAWAMCPHAYFVRYLLGVRPLEEQGDEVSISAADKGNVLHEVLDQFHREVLDGDLPQPGAVGWGAEHRRRLVELLDEVAGRYERSGRTGRPAYWEIDRLRIERDLAGWVEHDSNHIRARRATLIASERRFGDDGSVTVQLPGGRRLAVQGSVDRIDVTPEGLVVTDHKSGSTKRYADISELDPTAARTMFQLPAYAAAAAAVALAEGDRRPVSAEYSFFAKGTYRRIGYRFDDAVWRQVGDDVEHVVAGIESGWFPATPPKPGYRHFVECHYCEPDALGTVERYSEWERKQSDPRLARWFGAPA